MSQAVITARIDAEMSAKLDMLASRLGRTRSWLTARALETYIDHESEFLAAIQEGIDSLDRGEGVGEAAMNEFFETLLAELPDE